MIVSKLVSAQVLIRSGPVNVLLNLNHTSSPATSHRPGGWMVAPSLLKGVSPSETATASAQSSFDGVLPAGHSPAAIKVVRSARHATGRSWTGALACTNNLKIMGFP